MQPPEFPPEFEQRMRRILGEEWADFANVHEQNPPVSIRANPFKHYVLRGDQIAWTATGFYLDERPVFTLDPILHAGGYYVQEASSMFLEQAIKQATHHQTAINVLDLCAAPGGKSTHLLSLLSRESLLVSNEVIRSRTPVLSENIQKWGNVNTVVTNNDPKDFQKLGAFFDVVVIDAPCSGEGLFRKDPDAKNEWSPDNVIMCANRQRRILKDVWPSIKRGGILIYSTCTYSESENEQVLQWLNETADVEFIPLKLDPAWGVSEISIEDLFGYRLFPHRVKGEGFFLSVMRKLSGDETRWKSKKKFESPGKKITDQLRTWLKFPEENSFILRNENLVQALPANKLAEVDWLAENLHLVSSGTRVVTQKHDKLVPEHGFALSLEINCDNFNKIDLGVADAISYLRKDTITVSGVEKGFALVRFNELNLGWVNVLDHRINNLYPADWRIRMQDRKT